MLLGLDSVSDLKVRMGVFMKLEMRNRFGGLIWGLVDLVTSLTAAGRRTHDFIYHAVVCSTREYTQQLHEARELIFPSRSDRSAPCVPRAEQ